jgi:hypothetical protein
MIELEADLRVDLRIKQHEVVYLDFTSKDCQKLGSDGYIFLVRCDDIKPYAEGYKLTISIYNPYVIKI